MLKHWLSSQSPPLLLLSSKNDRSRHQMFCSKLWNRCTQEGDEQESRSPHTSSQILTKLHKARRTTAIRAAAIAHNNWCSSTCNSTINSASQLPWEVRNLLYFASSAFYMELISSFIHPFIHPCFLVGPTMMYNYTEYDTVLVLLYTNCNSQYSVTNTKC